MTIDELKELIKDLPGDMKVGNSGHFGEYLETYCARVCDVQMSGIYDKNCIKEKIFCISIEDPGEEPD